MTASDQELMERICVHDSHAFELLTEQYHDRVYRQVFSMLRDADAAEDIVQETFLRLWLRAEQWHGRGSFAAWLLRIASNLSLNYLRSVQRRRQQPLELPAELTEDGEDAPMPDWLVDPRVPEPGQVLEQREQGRMLQQLINGLPAEKREVFRLVHDAELEIRQVAELLHIPLGTVKSRLHYANKYLAREWQILAKEWEE